MEDSRLTDDLDIGSNKNNLNSSDEMLYNSSASSSYFLFITLIYFILRYYFNSKGLILLFSYFFAILLGEFLINLSLSKNVCGVNQYGPVALYTFLPWSIMFGLLQVMLNIFPGWLVPFSNTIGYLFVKIFGIGDLFNKILTPKAEKLNDIDSITKLTSEALEHIYNDRSLLINEITEDNLKNFWNNMLNAGLFKKTIGNDINLYNSLLSYIRIKDIIAECTWYILTGFLIISVSLNLLINSGCERSVDDIIKNSKIISNELINDKNSKVPDVYKDV